MSEVIKVEDFSLWSYRAQELLSQKEPFVLKITGPQAALAGLALQRSDINATTSNLVAEGVVITAAIVVGVIAVVGLGVVATVCIIGMNQGYSVKARHKTKGPMPFDDELELELVPPQN